MNPLQSKIDAAILQAVGEKLSREIEALTLFRPRGAGQIGFAKSLARLRILRGAPRTGKSLTSFAETASALTGLPIRLSDTETIPFKYPTHRGRIVWSIGFGNDHISQTIYRMLFTDMSGFQVIKDEFTGKWRAWNPEIEYDVAYIEKRRNADPLIPERFLDGGMKHAFGWEDKSLNVFSQVKFKNGSKLYAFTSGGEPKKGDPVDLVHVDEDIKFSDHVYEWWSRLADYRGRFIWSVFPESSNMALLNFSKLAEEEVGAADPIAQEFVLDLRSNKFIDDKTKAEQVKVFAHAGEAVLAARERGEFTHKRSLVYPSFDPKIHTALIKDETQRDRVDEVLRETKGEPPDNWTRYFIIDPGHSICAGLFLAVPPPEEFGDYVIAYDEVYQRQSDAVKMAEECAPKMAGHFFEDFIMDWHGGRITPMGMSKTVKMIYREAFNAFGLRCVKRGANFADGSDNVPGRIAQVRNWLAITPTGKPKLRLVINRTAHMQEEFMRYMMRIRGGDIADEPIAQHNHILDCYDSETEVLTDSGWKRFANVNDADKAATVNLETNKIEYQTPLAKIKRPYSGEMFRFGGHKMNAMVTPGHRMVVYPKQHYAGYDHGNPIIKEAQDLTVWDRLKLHANWDGAALETVLVDRTKTSLQKELDPGDFAEFLGWYIAEGSVDVPKCPGHGYRVVVSQTCWKKHALLKPLLDRLPWHWMEDKGGFYASSQQLWNYLAPLGDKYTKRIPDWIKHAEPEVIRRFMIGAVLGDGWEQDGRRTYVTVSPLLADDIQELFIKIGKSASIRVQPAKPYKIRGRTGMSREQFWVGEFTCPHGALRNMKNEPNFEPVRYDGTVHCLTVPNGTLIVRRHGKPMVCGNCLGYAAAYQVRYVRPRPSLQQISPAYRAFKRESDDDRNRRRRTGQEFVHLGPGAALA